MLEAIRWFLVLEFEFQADIGRLESLKILFPEKFKRWIAIRNVEVGKFRKSRDLKISISDSYLMLILMA